MKVAFNARLLAAPTLRGWNRYTINLLAELPALGVEAFLYSDQPLHSDHLARLPKNIFQVRIAPRMRYLFWEQNWLPRQCQKDSVDILHSPLNFGLPWSSPCPSVLTLHDAIDQVYYSQHSHWLGRLSFSAIQSSLYHWTARTRADHIITVSEHSKKDLMEQLHIPERKISVTYEAADGRFHQPVDEADRRRIRSRYGLDDPYVFYVGGWEKRKNIPFLIRAFAQASLDGVSLVLAGGRDKERAELVRLAESLNVTRSLKLLGWVDDEDLPALYAEALCFVFPSEYEGFGLQLCEAMATGCPVLAAKASCLPEILDGGGESFALNSVNELEGLLKQLTMNDDFRRDLVQRASMRAEAFSWKKTAIATKHVYERLKKGHS